MEFTNDNISHQLTQEEALKIIRDSQAQRYQSIKQREAELAMKHRKTTLKGFKYDLSVADEYSAHARLVKNIADNLMLKELGSYQIDEHNKKVLQFLLFYFNGCELAEKVFPEENYKLNKNILLIGEPGTGKTLIMQIFSDYLRATENEMAFHNISATQLMNYHKVNGHINKYTYNQTEKGETYDGCAPLHICLNDLGLKTENQKSFGTLLNQVMDEFLFARYEIYQQYQKRYHITSNLTVKDLKERFESRLVDRFKSFNVIELRGGSRRK